MAWNDTPPTDAELKQSAPAANSDWSSAPPTAQELQGQSANDPVSSLMKSGYSSTAFNALTPEQQKQYEALSQKEASQNSAGIGRGIEQGAGLPFRLAAQATGSPNLNPSALSSSFEKNVVAPVGDLLTGNDTSEVYNNLTPEQMQNTYNQQIQGAAEKSPGGFMLGNIAGTAPTYALGGGVVGAGSQAAGQAANLGKLGQAALNIGSQSAGTAALAGGQGYTENPYATEAQKMQSAKTGAMFGGLLGGAGAAVAEAPGVISSLGQNTSNKLLANAALGAEGVNTATQAGREAITQQGESLASKVAQGVTDLNNTIGEESAKQIQDVFGSAAKDAQMSVEDVVNKVTNNLNNIAQTSGQAATDTINESFADALKQTGEQLNLTGGKLTDFIKDGLKKYGPVIKQEIANASAQGKTIPMDENFLRTFLAIKNAKVSLSEASNVQDKLWKNWADTLYDTTENTVKQSTSTIGEPNAIGGPFTKTNTVVQGKGQPPSALPNPAEQPNLLKQAQPPAQPAAPQAAPTEPGVNAPLVEQNIKSAQSQAGNLGGEPTSGQSITQVNKTYTPKTEIPIAEAKQMSNALGNAAGNPNLEEVQPLAADLASQLRKSIKSTYSTAGQAANDAYSNLKSALEEMGVSKIDAESVTGDNITPDGITAFIKKAAQLSDQGDTATLERVYNHLNEVDPTFAAGFKQEVDAVSNQTSAIRKAQNASVQTKADVLQQQGLASPQVGKAQQTLQNIGQVQKDVGSNFPQIRKFVNDLNPSDIGSQADLQRTLQSLDQIDPESAAILRDKATQSAVSRNNALSDVAGKSPLEKAQVLKQYTDSANPASQAAAKLEDLSMVNKNIGAKTDLGMPSDTTRNFIKNYGITADTPSGSATRSDIEAITQKLAGLDPTLAAAVETEAPVIGRQLRAIDYGQAGSPFGSPMSKALGGAGAMAYKGANVAGQLSRVASATAEAATPLAAAGMGGVNARGLANSPQTKQNAGANTYTPPFAAHSLDKLSQLVQSNPQVLGKYAGPLQDAAQRGSSSLAATNFALYQNDPDYRAIIDPLQAQGEKIYK